MRSIKTVQKYLRVNGKDSRVHTNIDYSYDWILPGEREEKYKALERVFTFILKLQ